MNNKSIISLVYMACVIEIKNIMMHGLHGNCETYLRDKGPRET